MAYRMITQGYSGVSLVLLIPLHQGTDKVTQTCLQNHPSSFLGIVIMSRLGACAVLHPWLPMDAKGYKLSANSSHPCRLHSEVVGVAFSTCFCIGALAPFLNVVIPQCVHLNSRSDVHQMASHPAIVILSEVSVGSCLHSLGVRNVSPLYSTDSPVPFLGIIVAPLLECLDHQGLASIRLFPLTLHNWPSYCPFTEYMIILQQL